MTQYIVTHIDGSKLNLHSRAKGTYVEKAIFRNRWQSYAELTLEITAYTAPEWAYFDRIVIDDTPVFLHEWNEAQHIDNKGTKYILHFYGIEKMLFEASPFLDIDSAGAYISKDKPPIVGNLELFGNVLCNCINYRAYDTATGQRYKQDTIKLGTCPAGTKHLLVSTTEYNAFAALLAVCSAFKTHYTITTNPAGDTDYLLNFGVAPGVYAPLAYGRGKGLYRLDRKSISSENVKTILTVLGSSKNLPQGYGKQRLELDETLYPGSIIADNDKIQTFGAWNDVYIAEDIMPEYRGEILGVDTEDKYTFYCELDDFDPTGGTLNMLTGNLAGSNFRIAAFNAASGKVTVEELVDSSGFAVPSVAPYLFATGDTFTIVDIPMPQAYIETAQQALAEAGQARYLEISQPRVAYNVALHSRFVKNYGSRPKVGMYFPITDARYGVNKAIQCVTLERNLLAQDEYEYTNCEVADNVVETLGAKIYKQSKEAQALLKHLGATHLTTPTSSLQGAVRTAQSAAVAAAEAVAALEAEAARVAAEAYADGILSAEEAARIADVAAKLTEAKQYAAAQAAAAESAAKTYAEGQAAAAQAAAEAVAAAEAEAAELAANAYADGIVTEEEQRAIAEAAAKLTEAKNYAESQAAAAESAASTYAAAQAEAARLAAIASAKTYTDTEVTAAKGYADSTAAAAQSAAEAYALAKANLAETNAEAYADGIVDAEEAARIADATAKLNEAKTYAEQKATTAENAAKAYADTQLGNFATTVTGSLSDLQNQIDGSITTHFYAYVPTTSNAPASGWTTTALKNQHIGDLFYVNNDSLEEDGFCYRWTGTAWELIKDTQITKALADAAEAKDTADSKRRVFVATPTTPYDIGDLWLKSGDLYKCKVTRATGSYVASDWEKGVKYTDDTAANANLVTAKAYADTKKAEAIAAAEAAAEAEALAAQTAAEAHADGIVTAEEQARIADVNAKLATAKTYAETKASEAQTAAQQYAATAASNAQSAAESYALAKANLAETTAKAYADGVVSDEEARAIADATAKMNEAKAHAETKATEAKNAAEAAAALDATAKANAAKSAAETYALAKANLAETTAKAYADGIVDAEEARAIADATAKANAAKAAAEATAAALDDAIRVGGRNLLKGTTDGWTTLNMGTSWYVQFFTDTEIEVGETYTFSVIIEKVSIDSVPINVHLGVGTTSYEKDISYWRLQNIEFGKRVVLTKTLTANDLGTHKYFAWRIRNERQPTMVRYKEGKLEKGNKATDWTPAPEDVQEDYATKFGYSSYSDLAAKAAEGKTIMEGGYLRNSLIDTEHLIAHDAFINRIATNSITIGKITDTAAALDDAMQIGGRNLYPNTSDKYATITFSGWQYFFSYVTIGGDSPLQIGDTITWSGYLKSGVNPLGLMLNFRGVGDGYIQRVSSFIPANSEGKVTATTIIPANVNRVSIALRHNSGSAPTATVQYKELKLEKGNKATDWTPAPEDVQEDYATKFGYSSYSDLVAKAAAGRTIIEGSYLNTDLIEARSIVAGKIATGTITANEIKAGTITANNIANSTITGGKIALATITAANIFGGTITATEIADATITGGKIALTTITAANIANSTITGGKIAGTTITAANIAAGTITANEIDVSSLTTDSAFITAIEAMTITADSLLADTAFLKSLATESAFIDELTGNTAFISALTVNSLSTVDSYGTSVSISNSAYNSKAGVVVSGSSGSVSMGFFDSVSAPGLVAYDGTLGTGLSASGVIGWGGGNFSLMSGKYTVGETLLELQGTGSNYFSISSKSSGNAIISSGEFSISKNKLYISALPTSTQTGGHFWSDSKGHVMVGAASAYTAADVGAVPTTRKVNSKALSGDITLSASDVGAVPTTDIQYFTQAAWNALTNAAKNAIKLAIVY